MQLINTGSYNGDIEALVGAIISRVNLYKFFKSSNILSTIILQILSIHSNLFV